MSKPSIDKVYFIIQNAKKNKNNDLYLTIGMCHEASLRSIEFKHTVEYIDVPF